MALVASAGPAGSCVGAKANGVAPMGGAHALPRLPSKSGIRKALGPSPKVYLYSVHVARREETFLLLPGRDEGLVIPSRGLAIGAGSVAATHEDLPIPRNDGGSSTTVCLQGQSWTVDHVNSPGATPGEDVVW